MQPETGDIVKSLREGATDLLVCSGAYEGMGRKEGEEAVRAAGNAALRRILAAEEAKKEG